MKKYLVWRNYSCGRGHCSHCSRGGPGKIEYAMVELVNKFYETAKYFASIAVGRLRIYLQSNAVVSTASQGRKFLYIIQFAIKYKLHLLCVQTLGHVSNFQERHALHIYKSILHGVVGG
jgi:hypothetical protein